MRIGMLITAAIVCLALPAKAFATIEVVSVPEPASILLVLAGTGAVTAAARALRKR